MKKRKRRHTHCKNTAVGNQRMQELRTIMTARALPAPGPATVRLALLRTGIEVFGLPYVESVLFPLIRALPLHIRPPERVALSSQLLRAYKHAKNGCNEAPISREMAHAHGSLFPSIFKFPDHAKRFLPGDCV